ncbi:MAG: type II toxin-antitoxin system RelE/ParE family toxin [Draconibacterium sp.]
MVKRKIIWSPRSEIDIFQILEFYGKRNGNYQYSKRIYSRIRSSIHVLRQFPGIGAPTDIENVKNLILGEFSVFYRIEKNAIEIIAIWDNRQNPANLNLK